MKKQLLAIASLAALIGASLATAGALSVQPSQEFGKTAAQGVLTVEPVEVNSFSQLTEPGDIQPAGGYNLDQRTTNPQAQVND